jgi:prepilin-type N-terminal cleavage/methylation domain-containing protein
MKSAGFTLLEVMAVLIIVGLFAAAVTLTPSGWFASARFDEVADQVTFMDQLARQRARRGDRQVELTFDLPGGRIERRDVDGEHHITLPRGYEMTNLIVNRQSGGRRLVKVAVDRSGYSPSYAVRIIGPDHESRWILIAGLSGQAITLDGDKELDDAFDKLAS